ncbi:MAG: acetyl-CoA C-acyltransferase, partial [Micrococcales bacterium]|nr:acetyl-CoA C-acyltransferase [Micrococcales bacterium]
MPDRSAEPSAPLVLLGRRTPLTRAGTALADVPVHRLLAPILQRLVTETGLAPESVADVVMGNAVGAGGNLARLSALEAGLPLSVPGVT